MITYIYKNNGKIMDAGSSQWFAFTGWIKQTKSNCNFVCMSRQRFENILRQMLLSSFENSDSKLNIVTNTKVTNILFNKTNDSVIGVSLDKTQILADFVIDTSGKSSNTPVWFRKNGKNVTSSSWEKCICNKKIQSS